MKTSSEVMRDARAVLFERGWCQGKWDAEDGSVCLEGAVNIARGSDLSDALEQSDLDVLTAAIGIPEGWSESRDVAPWFWNDSFAGSFDEVIDVLDRAEKIAEQREADAH